jgi:hypothetical protein
MPTAMITALIFLTATNFMKQALKYLCSGKRNGFGDALFDSRLGIADLRLLCADQKI